MESVNTPIQAVGRDTASVCSRVRTCERCIDVYPDRIARIVRASVDMEKIYGIIRA